MKDTAAIYIYINNETFQLYILKISIQKAIFFLSSVQCQITYFTNMENTGLCGKGEKGWWKGEHNLHYVFQTNVFVILYIYIYIYTYICALTIHCYYNIDNLCSCKRNISNHNIA